MSGNRPYGRLWIVGAPADANDITLRALAVLKSVSFVAAEDIERVAELLERLDLRSPLLRDGGGDAEQAERILASLASGADVAFLVDADDPGGSEQAVLLVKTIIAAGYQVLSAAGSGAATEAISVAGIPAGRYHFAGFLAQGKSKRSEELRALAKMPWPIVLLESAGRALELIADAKEMFGDRAAALYQGGPEKGGVLHGRLSEIEESFPRTVRGRIALVVAGAVGPGLAGEHGGKQPATDLTRRAAELLREGKTRPQVARLLVQEFAGAVSRSEAYKIAIAAAATPRVVRFQVRGHPHLRATHAKTLEFKRGSDLSLRETCVVGVAAAWDPAEIKQLRGRIEATLTVAGPTPLEERFEAEINPGFSSGERIIFRKSAFRCEATLGTTTTKGAADLDRRLIALLQQPDMRAEIVLRTVKPDEPVLS